VSTRVNVIVPANASGQPSWPYIDYDVEKKRDELVGALRRHLPDMEFSSDPAVRDDDSPTRFGSVERVLQCDG